MTRSEFKKKILDISTKVDPSTFKLAATFLCTGLSVGVIIPMMPQIANDLSLTSTQYGTIISSFALAKMIANVPAARLVDDYGRRTLIVSGLAILSLANLELASYLSFGTLMSSRITAGLGVAAFSTAATTFLADISTTKNRARTLAPTATAFAIGTAIGPALGGLLTSSFGVSGAFSIVGSAFVGISLANWMFLKEPFIPELHLAKEELRKNPAVSAVSKGRFTAWKQIIKDPRISSIVFMHSCYWFVLSGSQMTLLPLLLSSEKFGLDVSQLGLVFAAMSAVSVLGTPISGRLLDRFGRIQMILPSTFLVGASMCGAAMADNLPQFLPFLFAWIASSTVLSSGPTAFIADSVPSVHRTKGLALLRTAGDVGMLTGAISAGLLADQFSQGNVIFGNGAALMAVSSAMFLRFRYLNRKGGLQQKDE